MPKGWTNNTHGSRSKSWRWLQDNYQAVADHLSPFEYEATRRYDKGNYWWELRACDYYDEFEKEKICWGNLAKGAPFSLELVKSYVNAPACIMNTNDRYILGCINSKLLWWYLKQIAPQRRGGFIEAKPHYVKQLPIRLIDFENTKDKKLHDTVVKLVERMLQLNKDLQKAKTSHRKEVIQRQINTTDKQIDKLVYKLYDLTEKEIAIVEEGVK